MQQGVKSLEEDNVYKMGMAQIFIIDKCPNRITIDHDALTRPVTGYAKVGESDTGDNGLLIFIPTTSPDTKTYALMLSTGEYLLCASTAS